MNYLFIISFQNMFWVLTEMFLFSFKHQNNWYFCSTSFVDLLYFFLSCVCYAFVRVCLFVPCGHLLGKGLTSWLSFVVSNGEFVTFPLVSWVRCGT